MTDRLQQLREQVRQKRRLEDLRSQVRAKRAATKEDDESISRGEAAFTSLQQGLSFGGAEKTAPAMAQIGAMA